MADDGEKIIRLHPTAWMAPDWLPTGEALVHEWMQRHGENFRYLDAEGQWYEFVNGVWRLDEERRVNVLSAALCRDIGRAKKKSLRMKLESPRTVSGIAGRVKDECAMRLDVFDHDAAINTPSGEWSGRDQVIEHVREHYHSKITACHAPALGDPVKWKRFLKRIMGGNQDLIDYLQRLAGYCCSTSNGEQVLVCFHGSGQNGKTVFIRTITGILGTYAATASIETFLANKFDRHPEELAGFRGVRLVIASEPDAARSWNETMVKQITGGDKIRARFMRQNSFEYLPVFKIVVNCNHKPQLRTNDKAIRRRFHIVPFEVTIPDAEKIQDFEKTMEDEWPQIFAWMLDGWDQWKVRGLDPPDEVIAATTEYLAEQDLKADWIEERCDLLPDANSTTADLYADWRAYAEARGERIGSVKLFAEDMQSRGFNPHRTEKARGFAGIALKPSSMQGQHSFRYGE